MQSNLPSRQSLPTLSGLTGMLALFFVMWMGIWPSTVKAAPAVASNGLRLQLVAEQPTGVFWDSETIRSQTALLFALHLSNATSSAIDCSLVWDVVNAWGKVIRSERVRLAVPAQGVIHRRELIVVQQLGPYILRARLERNNETLRAALPFALIQTPASQLRPRSFFALQAPAFLSPLELDFYARLGVRVLVSAWQPDDADAASALESQLNDRLQRKIATVGIVSASAGQSPTDVGDRLRALENRYPNLSRWEVSGLAASGGWERSNATLARMLDADADMRLSLSAPVGREGNGGEATSLGINGVVLPSPGQETDRSTPLHPAAQLRSMLDSRAKISTAFAGRRLALYWDQQKFDSDADKQNSLDENAPTIEAAAELTTSYLQAIMAGATGLSTRFGTTAATPASFAFSGRSMARAAAFSSLIGRLEDTGYVRELFPESPVLDGALFQQVDDNSTAVATLWCASGQDGLAQNGRLLVHLPRDMARWPEGTRIYDLFGNELATATNRQLVVPISAAPVFLVAPLLPERLAGALRAATIEGVRPVAAQLLPLTRPLQAHPTARVRLQNLWPQNIVGTLRLTVPAGWKLATEKQSYRLSAGESRVFEFYVSQAPAELNDEVFTIAVSRGNSHWEWHQNVQMAVATKAPASTVKIDGNLNDWEGASWMRTSPGDKGASSARIALRWDSNNLYIAARVAEAGLRMRRTEESRYRFWDGYDALQLAFGSRQTGPPANRATARDTDYGFLLSPFGPDRTGGVAGRILWLWNHKIAFDSLTDQVRWGGVIAGARCVVRHDSAHAVTTYEASVPLSAMPELSPQARATSGMPLRFGWVLHRDDGPAVEWSVENAVFPWWAGTDSLYPPSQLYSAVQTPLGFTTLTGKAVQRQPAVRSQTSSPPPIHRTPVRPVNPNPVPVRRSVPRRAPEVDLPPPTATLPPPPERDNEGPNAGPPQLLPMPPSMLPPAAPPPGKALPPAPPDKTNG